MWEEGPVTNLLVCQPPPKDPESFCIWSIFAQYLFRIYLNLPEVFSFYLFSGIIVLWKLYKDAPIIIQSPTRLCEFTQKVQIKQQDLHLKVWRYFSKAFTFFSFYAQRSPITPLTNIFSKLVFWNCSKTILCRIQKSTDKNLLQLTMGRQTWNLSDRKVIS